MNRGIRIEWRVSGGAPESESALVSTVRIGRRGSGGVSNCKKLLKSMAGIEVAAAEHLWSPDTVNRGIRIKWRASGGAPESESALVSTVRISRRVSGGVSNCEKLLESIAGIVVAAARALQKAN